MLLGLLGLTLGVGRVGPERGVYVLLVDPVGTILRVLAALEGAYGNVHHVVAVVAVYLIGGERIPELQMIS